MAFQQHARGSWNKTAMDDLDYDCDDDDDDDDDDVVTRRDDERLVAM